MDESPLRSGLPPGLLDQAPPQVTTGPDASGPVAASQQGSLFQDGSDPKLRWYLPGYQLAPDPDPAFGFAAEPAGVDAQGGPYDRATLTLGLTKVVPADVLAAQQADSSLRFTELASADVAAELVLPYVDPDGTQRSNTVPAQLVADAGGGLSVRVTGLLGSGVLVAFTELTATGGAAVLLTVSYEVVEVRQSQDDVPPDGPWLPPVEVALRPVSASGTVSGAASVSASGAESGGVEQTVALAAPGLRALLPERSINPPPPAPRTVVLRSLRQTTARLELGTRYGTPSYRPLYTLTQAGTTAVIVDISQLRSFDVHQSEYAEITALGDVPTRYPSLRALYLGAVSGTVIAVPARYGILRGSAGCAAACDAIVDSSPSSASGCRFQLSFTLAPVLDPADLARLGLDLAAAAGLRNRVQRLTLPSDLDARTPSTLPSPLLSTVAYGVAAAPVHAFALTVGIADDSQPAIVKANMVLRQLAASGPAALFGRIAVRLDDVHQPPVLADVVLNLHTTAGSDDIALQRVDAATVAVSNSGPLDLRLTGLAGQTATEVVTSALDTSLPVRQVVSLPVPTGSGDVYLDRTLDLPDPFPAGRLASYVTVWTENVARVHHWLGANATGIDFAALRIGRLDLAIALTGAPDVAVPLLSLSAQHAVDSTAVEIPVSSAVTGLAAAVTVTVVAADPATSSRSVTLAHDFVDHPVLVLTAAAIA